MHRIKLSAPFAVATLLAFTTTCFAQGEDSSTAERDLMAIDAMLPGIYANANQSYFDGRGEREERHRPLFIDVRSAGGMSFVVTGYFDNDPESALPAEYWSLSVDESSNTVRMRSRRISEDELANPASIDTADDRPACDVFWRREAGQFRAEANGGCEGFAGAYQLSEPQLWIDFQDVEAGDYALHRARPFQCYADIPGVGGGVDIPYKRYDGFNIHDQGGRFRFTSDEGQDLLIMLWTVDWPINNQAGIFTRDSLVLYVNEFLEDGMKQHAYAFTPPASDRVGINLKWILVNCFMESNRDVTPSM
ncbi:MAG: hypothetical protein ACR2QR_01820 [Woeseiaceae bacterium]